MGYKIETAIIESIYIGIEDHGLLTMFLDLQLLNHDNQPGCNQGFGGWALYGKHESWATGCNFCGCMIYNILQVVGCNDILKLKEKRIRVKRNLDTDMLDAIGNITEDVWFSPKEVFTKDGKIDITKLPK